MARGWYLVGIVAACGRVGFGTVARTDGSVGSGGGSPRCVELAPICGPTGDGSCCASPLVPAGSFYRDLDATGYGTQSYPATLSAFRLDQYEVTVARFRQFVAAGQGTQQAPPPEGAGARTLGGVANQGGWDPAWNAELAPDTKTLEAGLHCNAFLPTWTDAPGLNEALPINCLTWYEAMAFCAWDGGFLPTEAEWDYAAQGGDQQRNYPWSSPPSSPTIGCSYTNYNSCAGGTANRVGSESPAGDGRWGQADLAGNVWEWLLDTYQQPYASGPCDDCASLTAEPSRSARGGGFTNSQDTVRPSGRGSYDPLTRGYLVGVRCARVP